MMRKSSDIKADIEKIRKLKALQIKATDKLNKITEHAAAKPPKKKKTKPAGQNKAKTAVKKSTLWKKVFGKKSKTVKRSRVPKPENKRPGKKGPGSSAGGNEGFIFRHFGRGRG
jgi:hypothetical protein